MEVPSLEEVYREIESLKSVGVTIEEIGRSGEDRPIYALRLGRGPARVAVVCGQHGNEPAPIIASLRALRTLASLGRDLDLFTMLVIPLANPDGFSKLRRCLEECHAPDWRCECIDARLTSSGIDMNREWLTLRTPENRCIHRALTEFEPHTVLDLHEFYAVGGAPPRWAHETEGFDAYVTDAPYLGVSPEIMNISARLAEIARRAVESSTGLKTRIRRPCSPPCAVPPIYLGSHFPLEGCAKVLVETWGVGLGSFMLYERVEAHTEVILQIVDYVTRNIDRIDRAKRIDADYDRVVGSHYGSKYVVRGRDVEEAHRVLSAHRIDARLVNGVLEVRMPSPSSRIALAMLEPEYELTRELEAIGRSVKLDRLLNVGIERVG